MDEAEVKKAFTKLLEYAKECWDKAPPDVKENLIGGICGTISVVWKVLEANKLDTLISNECLEPAVIRKKTNMMFGIGLCVEVLNLVGQYWRLKEFTQVLENVTNLKEESKKQVAVAIQYLKDAEKLIKDFDSRYGVEGKQITPEEAWEMSKMKDRIYDKLNEVKNCLSLLQVRVGNSIEVLQMKQTGMLVDGATGIAAGVLTFPQVLLGVDFTNPYLLLGAAAVGGLRIALGVAGLKKYDASKKMIAELQKELDTIEELGRQYKLLKENFQKLVENVCLTATGDGTFKIYIKQTNCQ